MKLAISETGYLIIAIAVVIILVALFFISYIMNKKTPIPKECQDLEESEACVGCKNITCSHYKSVQKDSKE
ncbi:MAG: hypothetical protein IJO27_04855 [Bacilli bacterium]|nr:hypothetical protein [Bacilli bacterium]